jgi:hypothetical protein
VAGQRPIHDRSILDGRILIRSRPGLWRLHASAITVTAGRGTGSLETMITGPNHSREYVHRECSKQASGQASRGTSPDRIAPSRLSLRPIPLLLHGVVRPEEEPCMLRWCR